jgi:serine/threonine-protein kinase RsbW
MEVRFTLHLPRDAASVPVVRRVCRCSFEALGVERSCVGDLEVAVTEACTNVLKHATETDDKYEVDVRTMGQRCEISVRDTGRGFDPAGLDSAASSTSDESGRGIHLMRVLVDRLQFTSPDGSGTRVRLEKSLALREDSPLRAARVRSP